MEHDKKSIEKQIQYINSKHCKSVLTIIYEEDGINQGEIARKLNLLPSGLSLVLKKMETSEIPLVNVSQTGKFRRYSLPEYVKNYMRDLNKGGDDEKVETEESLFLSLQRFVECKGHVWKEELNRLLLAEADEQSGTKVDAFYAFMENMKKKSIKSDDSVIDVKKFIDNEVLIYLIDKYIEADL